MEVIFTLQQIHDAAKELLLNASNNPVIALHGEMGAGKTTFIHACCEALGVSGHISSPTFSIINQYSAASEKAIYHIDLYRLKDEAEAIAAGVEECIFSGDRCFVEWPERAPGIFPNDALHITLSIIDDNKRKLVF